LHIAVSFSKNHPIPIGLHLSQNFFVATKKPIRIDQWFSTWAKSIPRGRFYAFWRRFCDLPDLGEFQFPGGRFCRSKFTKILNWFQK